MSPISKYQVRVPQETLRRLAPRARDVVERHANKPGVAAVSLRVVPATDAYEQAYDTHRLATLRRTRAILDSHERVEQLSVELAIWGPLFAVELESDASLYAPPSRVPDDVIATAKRFTGAVRASDEARRPVFTDEALRAVEQAIALAETSLEQARKARAEAEATGQAVRDTAVECQAALVLLRRVLTPVLGRRHGDYRSLRPRARVSEAEEAISGDGASFVIADEVPTQTPIETHGTDDRPSGEFDLEVAAE